MPLQRLSSAWKEWQCPLAVPGSIISATTSSGRTRPSSSRAWRPTASCRWRRWTAPARSCAPARARPTAARPGSRNGARSATRSRSAATRRWPRAARSRAGDYYLRAGIYHYNAERFIAPSPEKKAQCAHAYKVWHQGIRLRQPNVEFVEVPYEGTTLPALFMKAPGDGPEAHRRRAQRHGQRQGDEHLLLRARVRAPRLQHALPRRPRHGRDAPHARHAEPLRLRGAGGRRARLSAQAPRRRRQARRHHGLQLRRLLLVAGRGVREALRRLHRALARCTGTSPPGSRRSRTPTRTRPRSVAQSNFQWRWVAGAKDEDEGIEIAKKFSLKDVAKNITCPFLVTHGGNDRVVPVENAQKLYDAVGSTNKTHQDLHHRGRRRRARPCRQPPGRHRLRRRLAREELAEVKRHPRASSFRPSARREPESIRHSSGYRIPGSRASARAPE